MINKYISELVSANTRVIIPDFGAFMVQETPEGKVISFNDFLKFNDGLLVNHIIKNEKVNKNQALDQIKEFIKQAEARFSKSESFIIEGLGELTKDAQGNIKFSKGITEKTVDKKPDTEPTVILLDEKSAEVAKTEPEVSRVQAKPEVKTTEAPKPPVNKETISTKTEPIAASAFGSAKATSVKTTSTPIKPMSTATKPTTVIKTKKKSPLNTILVIVALLIIISAGVWAVITYHLIDRFMPAKEPIVVATDTIKIEVDTVVIDSSALTQPEPKIVEESVTNRDTKRCYLITGSFKVVANAERYSKKMTDQGFESEIIARANGYNAVSIKSFSTRKEALTEWQRIKDEYPGSWILIK
jgi:nucleoid DNA-binding protein